MTASSRLTPIAALLVFAALPLRAQELYDRGVFVLARTGAEVGREEFALRAGTGRGAAGGGLMAVSTMRIEGREIQRALEVTREYVPVSFQQTESSGGRVVARIAAQLAGIRFSTRITAQEGETAREFPVRAPVVILAADAYAAFYFVPRPDSGQDRAVTVVDPAEARSHPGTITGLGPDTVSIGTERVPARHFRLRVGESERHFWFTPAGDLLQVSQPAANLVATRAEVPHH